MLHQCVAVCIGADMSDNTRGFFSSLYTSEMHPTIVMAGFNFMADVCWKRVEGTILWSKLWVWGLKGLSGAWWKKKPLQQMETRFPITKCPLNSSFTILMQSWGAFRGSQLITRWPTWSNKNVYCLTPFIFSIFFFSLFSVELLLLKCRSFISCKMTVLFLYLDLYTGTVKHDFWTDSRRQCWRPPSLLTTKTWENVYWRKDIKVWGLQVEMWYFFGSEFWWSPDEIFSPLYIPYIGNDVFLTAKFSFL